MSSTQVTTQYLTFGSATDDYALNILQVREIIEYEPVTHVPRSAEFVAGVINLRGQVVPVVDLAILFGLPATTITRWTCIVIVDLTMGGEATSVGVLVDRVSQVISIPAQQIKPAPSLGSNADVKYLAGMAQISGKFVPVLNIDAILTATDMLELRAIRQSTRPPAGDASSQPTT